MQIIWYPTSIIFLYYMYQSEKQHQYQYWLFGMRRRVTDVGKNPEAPQETTTVHLISSLNSLYA